MKALFLLRYGVYNRNYWGAVILIVLGPKPCISSSLQIFLGICNCLERLSKILAIEWNIIVYLWLLIMLLLFWSWINKINHIQSDIIISECLGNWDTHSELLIKWIELFESTGRISRLLVHCVVLTLLSLVIFRPWLLISLMLRSLIHFIYIIILIVWF